MPGAMMNSGPIEMDCGNATSSSCVVVGENTFETHEARRNFISRNYSIIILRNSSNGLEYFVIFSYYFVSSGRIIYTYE